MEIDKVKLENIIQDVLAQYLSEKQGLRTSFEKQVETRSGVMAVKTDRVKPEPFDTGKEGDKVFLKNFMTLEESPRVAFGVMEMTQTTFEWTLNYDEVDVVLEGSLSIVVNGQTLTAGKGEVIFIPKNTTIEFSVPDHAKFIYMTYPANWSEL